MPLVSGVDGFVAAAAGGFARVDEGCECAATLVCCAQPPRVVARSGWRSQLDKALGWKEVRAVRCA